MNNNSSGFLSGFFKFLFGCCLLFPSIWIQSLYPTIFWEFLCLSYLTLTCESFKHKNGNQYGIYILNKNQFSIVLFACILLTLLHLNVCKLPKITQFDRRKIVFFLQQADSLRTINQKLGISCHGYGYFEKTWKRADKHL